MTSPLKPKKLAKLKKKIWKNCHLHGVFKLRSEQTSNEYFDTYQLLGKPKLLKKVVKAMACLVPLDKIDTFGGVELAGVSFATLLSSHTNIPSHIIRKEAKGYGTCQQAEGGPVKNKRMILVENVITTGGAVLECLDSLRKQGVKIKRILCLVDRRTTKIRKKWRKDVKVISLIKSK